jgi:hemolysin type calcium-binding protein
VFPPHDVMIGDSGTLTGAARGGGKDTLLGADDSDILFGDSHSQGGTEAGGDRNVLKAGAGDDSLDGGPRHDRCHGDGGTDDATRCEVSTGIP